MQRGRPIKSQPRQNIVEILFFLGSASGYDIYKVYKAVYPAVTCRLIYYHLKKGVSLEEFAVDKIKREEGNYSWGPITEKKFYKLGPNAKPKIDKKVKEYIENSKIKNNKAKNSKK